MFFHHRVEVFHLHLFSLINRLELRRALNPMFDTSEHYFSIPSAASILINSLGPLLLFLLGSFFAIFVKFVPSTKTQWHWMTGSDIVGFSSFMHPQKDILCSRISTEVATNVFPHSHSQIHCLVLPFAAPPYRSTLK